VFAILHTITAQHISEADNPKIHIA